MFFPAYLVTWTSVVVHTISITSWSVLYFSMFALYSFVANHIVRFSEVKMDGAEVLIHLDTIEEHEVFVYQQLYLRSKGKYSTSITHL